MAVVEQLRAELERARAAGQGFETAWPAALEAALGCSPARVLERAA